MLSWRDPSPDNSDTKSLVLIQAEMASRPSESGPTNEPPILILSRDITIRAFRKTDAESLAKYGNDREMWLNGPDVVPYPFLITDGEEYIKRALDSSKWLQSGDSWAGPARSVMYAIAKNDVAIGSIEFWVGEDIRARSANLGYWIGRDYWGQGIATEVVKEFVPWIFETFPKIVRIDAEVHDFNPGSGKVLSKVGFTHLTTLDYAIWKDGKLAGLELWGMVRPELLK